ncbi:hypothetical protein G4B11_000199 [Aspergillus flavus]|nr:hypothetical protein G4B11_000199 [Aspergillus flavus]
MYLSVLSFVDSDSLTSEQQQHYALALYFDRKCAITGKIYQSHSDQTFHAVSKGKFYRAVMARFLDTKMLQFATLCQDLESLDWLTTTTSKMWSDNPNRTLEESFQILEAFDFISNFMLLHILKGPGTFADWVILSGEHQAFTQDPDDSFLNNWISLLRRLQPYLSPFDILATFRMDEIDLQTLQYFTSLLSFEEYDLKSPIYEIEKEVCCKLNEEYDVADHVWKIYRNHGWRNGARGTSFNEHLSVGTIASEIIGFECHRRNWWELMKQSSKASPYGVRFSLPSFYLSTFNERTYEDEDIHFIITQDDLLTLNH